MCQTIFINSSETEIETAGQMEEYFGVELILATGYKDILPTACLCQIDIKTTLEKNKIPFKTDGYDYWIGELDQLILETKL